MTDSQLILIFQILSLGLCVLLAYLARTKWHRLRMLVPAWALQLIYLFLVIQIILLVINIIIILRHTGANLFPADLWYLDRERTIPSILSTIQLILLGILCLATGITSGKISRAERLYWLVLCLGIILVALIEYDILPRRFFNLSDQEMYMPPGLFVLAATLTLILRNSDGKRRLSLSLLLAGLGVWALGALLIDNIRINNSDNVIVFLEETLETLGTLVALAGVAGYAAALAPSARTGRIVIVTGMLLFTLMSGNLIDTRYRYGEQGGKDVASVTAIEKLVYPYRTLAEEWLFARRILVTIDDHALTLTGWHFDFPQAGESATMHLWLHAGGPLEHGFGFALQLLDQESGAVLAAANKMSWNGRNTEKWQPGRQFTRSQAVKLTLPADPPVNRALWLTLSFWEYEGNVAIRPLPVDSSDYPLLGETHVILDELVFPETVASASLAEAPGRFANGFVLQAASFPGQAQAGETLAVTFRWGSESAGSEDWTQFLHLVHEESGSLWNFDQPPLGLRLPTRLWYAGLQASEAWRFTLPADLQPGQYSIYSGLYRLSDMQRLSVTLADGTQPADARIPLGTILIEG